MVGIDAAHCSLLCSKYFQENLFGLSKKQNLFDRTCLTVFFGIIFFGFIYLVYGFSSFSHYSAGLAVLHLSYYVLTLLCWFVGFVWFYDVSIFYG